MSATAFEDGMNVRREMWGPELAERALQSASPFAEPFQDMLTRYCFGEVWSRPGLGRRDRSLLTLSMLIPQGKALEIKMHTKAALTNGVTVEELREVMVHSIIYCGVPCAHTALRAMEEALAEVNEAAK